MNFDCTFPCTLCLMYRELRSHQLKGGKPWPSKHDHRLNWRAFEAQMAVPIQERAAPSEHLAVAPGVASVGGVKIEEAQGETMGVPEGCTAEGC